MTKKNKIKLLKGVFSPEDSKEILNNLYKSKISFHNMKNFSSNERLGKPDSLSVKRIPELKKCIENISALLNTALENGYMVKLNSVIEIEFVTKKSKK